MSLTTSWPSAFEYLIRHKSDMVISARIPEEIKVELEREAHIQQIKLSSYVTRVLTEHCIGQGLPGKPNSDKTRSQQ